MTTDYGEAKGESGPFSRLAFRPYITTVRFNNVLGDSQSQAGTLTAARPIRLVEPLENVGQVFPVNPPAGICYLDNSHVPRLAGTNYNSAVRAVEFYGIVNKIGYHLSDALSISQNCGRIRGHFSLDSKALAICLWLKLSDYFLY